MTHDQKWQFVGWVLFIFCAVLYLIAGLRNGDAFSIAGSLIFLIACFAFLKPFLSSDDA